MSELLENLDTIAQLLTELVVTMQDMDKTIVSAANEITLAISELDYSVASAAQELNSIKKRMTP